MNVFHVEDFPFSKIVTADDVLKNERSSEWNRVLMNPHVIYIHGTKQEVPQYETLFLLSQLYLLTPWFMKSRGSIIYSQGLSNNSYPEPNQPNSSY
jgi:hypothetical protein